MPQNLRISELTDGGNVRVGDVFPANRGGQTLRMLYSGGGLVFRNPADEFVGATLAACRTARSTYFTTTSTTAFQDFIANRFLAIVLNPTNSTDNVFETYTGSGSTYDDTMWVDRTGTAQGIPGDVGAQARFSVFGYINTATAPTVAPTGGTFVQSTDTLTLPTGYTALPSTPASGSKTYVIEAVINPVVDADTVTLIWPVPAELPAYLAAAFAEAAQAAAENAADRAEQAAGRAVDIPTGSPRGALVATSPTLPTAATGFNTVIAFGAAEVWTVEADAPDGFEAGPTANNERLYLPDIHPAGSNGIWLVVEVDGVDIAESFISHGGIQGAATADRRIIVPVSVTADTLIRTGYWPRASTVASYIQITGNNDTLPANTVVKIYLSVVRGDPGGGGPGGGGLTEAQANALIATALTAAVESNTETGITVTYNTSDGTFDFVVTDAGGQTQAEVDARIVAALTAAVTGNTETGITVTYASGKLNFVVTGGGGGGGLTQAQVNTLIADALTAAVTGNTETGITVTYDDADGTFDFVVPATGRTAAQVDASITAAFVAAVTGNTETRINVEYDPDDGTLDFVVDDPPGLTEAEVDTRITNAFAAAVTNNTETGIVVTYNSGDGTYDFVVSGMTPGPPSDDIYFGTSGNDTPSGSELTVAAVNGVGTIRRHTLAKGISCWRAWRRKMTLLPYCFRSDQLKHEPNRSLYEILWDGDTDR